MSDFLKAIPVADLAPGRATEVWVGGRAFALYNVGGQFYATSNSCIHRGGPLGQGMLDGCVIMCPWHAWTFDVTTGENTVNAELKVGCFPVKIEDGFVFVKAE